MKMLEKRCVRNVNYFKFPSHLMPSCNTTRYMYACVQEADGVLCVHKTTSPYTIHSTYLNIYRSTQFIRRRRRVQHRILYIFHK